MISTAGQNFNWFNRFLRRYFPRLFRRVEKSRGQELWNHALHTPVSQLKRQVDPFAVRTKYNL